MSGNAVYLSIVILLITHCYKIYNELFFCRSPGGTLHQADPEMVKIFDNLPLGDRPGLNITLPDVNASHKGKALSTTTVGMSYDCN